MTTLVIYHGHESELAMHLANIQTELQSKGVTDVAWIINPKDISDLENQLATYQGQFESLFVNSHGGIRDGITTVKLTDENVPVYDALKIFNKGNEKSLKNIHFLSCHIGSIFHEENFFQKLEDLTVNGQRVILHGDQDIRLKHDSYAIMTSLIGSDSNIVTHSIINSPAVINVFAKLDEGSRIFSSQSFTSLEQKSISLKSFLPHMRVRLQEANAFEKEVGITTREVDYSLLEDENWLKTYFSKAFLTDISKISTYERKSSLLLAWVSAIKSQEIDLNYIPPGGLSALYYGALNSRLELVEFVLSLGADANLYCDHRSPIDVAAQKGQVDIIKLLKSAGAKLDAIRNDTGSNSLHIAAQHNHLNVVKYLHQNGVKYNHINFNGSGAIHVAAENGSIDIIRYFHEMGENLNIGDKNNKTALYKAVQTGNSTMVHDLCRLGVDVNIARKDTGSTAILQAATKGNLPIIKLLYEFGAKLDVTSYASYAILHVAAEYDHLDIVKYLYELDLNLESITSKLNETHLYIAAHHGALNVVNFLIEKGEDLNIAENKEGWTPFMHLLYTKDRELIKKAIRYGADIDIQNKKGNSALDLAKKIGFSQSELDDFKEIAQEYKLVKEHSSHKNAEAALDAALKGDDKSFAGFIAEGMNVNYTRNKAGATFLHLAAHNNNLNIAQLCIDAGIDVNIARKDTGSTAIFQAAIQGNLPIIKLLYEFGAKLDVTNFADYTILHVAAEYDHLDIAKYLYELDLNLESITSKLNETHLYIAAHHGALNVVNFLIEKGEDLNIAENKEGWTPFMHLLYTKDRELIKKAIRYGADIDIQNKKGNSALDIAEKIGFSQSELDDFKEIAQEYKLVKEHSSHKNARAALDAAFKGDDKSFAGFLAEGMNVKYTRNKAGATFLHLAAHNNNLNIVQLCIDAGIDVNIARKDTGSTALYIAAQKGHIKLSDVLIENGADLNIRHKVDGWTPFMHILYTKDIALIKKAISYGGNMNDASTLEKASAIGLDVDELLQHQKLVKEENIAGVFPHAEADYQAVDVTLPASNIGVEVLETGDINPNNEGWTKETKKTQYLSAQAENDGESLSFTGLPKEQKVIELDEITVFENELEEERMPRVDLSYDNTIGEAYSEDNNYKKGKEKFSPSSVVQTKDNNLKIVTNNNNLKLR